MSAAYTTPSSSIAACGSPARSASMGVPEGGRVAVLAPNTHVLLEAHFGVPFAGAVLVALNTRLTAGDLSFAIAHSERAGVDL